MVCLNGYCALSLEATRKKLLYPYEDMVLYIVRSDCTLGNSSSEITAISELGHEPNVESGSALGFLIASTRHNTQDITAVAPVMLTPLDHLCRVSESRRIIGGESGVSVEN